MRGGLIFCALRNKLGGHALATAKLSEKMGCAFDIAGSEQAQFGLEGGDLKEALAFCKEHEHGCAGVTVHAGEVAGTRGNLAVALAEGSGVGRIGHGAAMAMGEGWEEMSEKGAESGVVVEVCLTAISTCASEASIYHSRAQPLNMYSLAYNSGSTRLGPLCPNKHGDQNTPNALPLVTPPPKFFARCVCAWRFLPLPLTLTHASIAGTASKGFAKMRDHPVRRMLEAGISVALGSDNLLLSGDPDTAQGVFDEELGGGVDSNFSYANPTVEVANLVGVLGLEWETARSVVVTGLEAGFFRPDDEFKRAFVAELDQALAQNVHTHASLAKNL